jgi:hypothetical protein
MKKIIAQIFFGLFAATCARADTALTITSGSPYGCLQNAYLFPTPLKVAGNFTLSGVSGTGTVQSSVPASAPTFGYPPEAYFYNYSIDLSSLSPTTTHCVKLLIHFGTPDGCGYDEVFGSPSAIQSATLAPFGDITFVFAGGCVQPGQPAVGFLMFSEAAPKTGVVTVIDDYVDPASGSNVEARINVTAIVPDIPPDPPPWLYLYPIRIPYAWFQGDLDVVGTNQFKTNLPPVTGLYDFTLQLLHAPSNGLASSQLTTQTVQVVNGLFNLPLPFDPITMGDGSAHWLNLGVRPSGLPAVQFTPVGPPQAIAPTPQAYYAYSAGVVADLTPGQAVTSLNGLTDAVQLQAGNGILLGTNGNTLILSAQPGVVSDKNLKTDFTQVQPQEILARLAALPIQGWRYTNEIPGARHVGPMSQDFKAAFGLGEDNKLIQFVDEEGVALAAIQGLNQKLNEQLAARDAELAGLKARLAEMERRLKTLKPETEIQPAPP